MKSIAIEKALAGTRAGLAGRSRRRSLQADQQPAVPPRLPRVRLPLHARRAHAARSQAVGVQYQDQSNVGRWRPRRRVCDAAATPGSSPTRRSRTARRIGRIRRPSPAAPENVPAAARPRSADVVADPFMGLGSTAVACAQLGVRLRRDRDGRGLSARRQIERTRAALNGNPLPIPNI